VLVLVLVLVNRAENENDYDHDCDRDDDYDYDDEDEYDSIPLCRCGLRRQLSPRDENIDSIPSQHPSSPTVTGSPCSFLFVPPREFSRDTPPSRVHNHG